MKFLLADLTAKLGQRGRSILALGILALALAIALALPLVNVLGILGTATALILIAVALRIHGPKDAKSFRLYRRPVTS